MNLKKITRFSMFVLGVHSKASHFAVQSERGQCPLTKSALVMCIKLLMQVVLSSDKSLINKAYRKHRNNSISQW